jgi:alpha-galactosidase
VLTISATLTNRGELPLALGSLAPAILPLPPSSKTIRSFTGRHNTEFQEVREALPAHGWHREERRGLTGHGGPAGLFVLGDGAGWHRGPVHAVQLAWSGNSRLSIERDGPGWTLAAGEWLAAGEIRPAAGEAFTTPELLATYSSDGLNGASANFHQAIRSRAPRAGLYFDQDEARLMALADRAAAIGVERFVLDDGWFRGRPDDRSGLGDWQVDRAKYPDGFKTLADHVRKLGMEFGLWVEPEMVNPDSDLYRAHPDWPLHIAGRAMVTARNQLVLDMSRADVRDYLFDALGALLGELPIAYLKWDHNRHLATAGNAHGGASYHAQVMGTYALIDRVRAAHPGVGVEIESCAGGGGRIDAGIATRVERFWASDNLDAVSCTAIQRGFLAFMPPEMMGAHVGASPSHATGRVQPIEFRAGVALCGHFGVELDPARLNDVDRDLLADWIATYKTHRDRLHSGQTWLGEEPGLMWQAVGDPAHLILFVTVIDPPTDRLAPVRLPMLAGDGDISVRLLGTADAITATYSASWLAGTGLPLPHMAAHSVAISELKAA